MALFPIFILEGGALMAPFATKLRLLRIAGGMTAHEAAAKIGIDQGSLSRYESAVIEPGDTHKRRLERHFGCPVDELLRRITPVDIMALR